MPASQPENLVNSDQLPPLAAEDHVCDFCAVVYPKIRIDDAVSVIVGVPGAVRDAVCAIPLEVRRVRSSPNVWSVTEYVCHLRDVYVAFTIRLRRVRTENQPALESMFNDLRARRFRTTIATSRPHLTSWRRLRLVSATKSRVRENATGIAW
jgi:hypothetical protein